MRTERQDQPLVSVIIPHYNQRHFVQAAVDSALNQSYSGSYEIIVVDDGSTDDCTDVVRAYGDARIHYIWQANQGLAGARNTGIGAARGEYVGLLDADDQWEPTFLARMLRLAEEHPESVVYYCQARCMDSRGNVLPQLLGGPVVPPAALYDMLLRANFLIPSTILMRRAAVVDAGLFDPRLRSCEDWELWLRLLPRATFAGTDECLVRYRLHGSSLSTNLSGMHAAAASVIQKHFGPDDGQPTDWSAAKRRAYGGLYRYYTLTHVLRQQNWQAASGWLRRALHVDPTLAVDFDLFYDLALGAQPVGYRGTPERLSLDVNARQIAQCLDDVFALPQANGANRLRRATYGTAYGAIGLVAYNTGQLAASRRYLAQALLCRPDLRHDARVVGDLIKACLGRPLLNAVRRAA